MLMNHYGIESVAEKKYINIIQGLINKKIENIRMTLFASFMGIPQYNEGDLEFYLRGMYYMTKISTAGVNIVQNDNSESQLVPFVRAMEFATKYFHHRLRKAEWIELKNKVILYSFLTKID